MQSILILDSIHPKVEASLLKKGFKVVKDYESSKEDVMQNLSKYDGLIIRSRFTLDRTFLEQASTLKFIVRYGAGLENIDLAAAEKMSIECIRVPEGNRDAVGEQAIGMLLMLFNNLKRADTEVRNGIWKREENRGLELFGKTVGIIGYGHMGSGFAEKLQGFNCNILAYDKYKTNFAPSYVEEVSLERVFKESDILSIHVPLTTETKMMVDDKFLNSFSKPIYLINTARGPILNTKSLLDAIESNKVAGACLDVLEFEKNSFETLFEKDELPKSFKELVASERVILSPHIAGWSFESYEKLADFTLNKIIDLYEK